MKIRLKVLKVTSKNVFAQAYVGGLPLSGLIGLYPISDLDSTPDKGESVFMDVPEGFQLVVNERVVDTESGEMRPFFALTYA